MKKLKGIDFQTLMGRLSNIPGLHFMKTWLTEYRMTRTRVRQRVGDLKGYGDLAREGAAGVRGEASTSDDELEEEHRDDYRDGDDSGYSEDDYANDYYTDDDYEY